MRSTGKVRRRACGQHTSEPKNARMRGRSCPKALVSPEPERVCPKVGAKPHKSCFSSPGGKGEAWKRRSEPPVLEPGEPSGFWQCELAILQALDEGGTAQMRPNPGAETV